MSLGSEKVLEQRNGERRGSGAGSCPSDGLLNQFEPRNDVNSRKSLPTGAELLLHMPDF